MVSAGAAAGDTDRDARRSKGIPQGLHEVTYTDTGVTRCMLSEYVNNWRQLAWNGDDRARDWVDAVWATLVDKLRAYVGRLEASRPGDDARITAVERYMGSSTRRGLSGVMFEGVSKSIQRLCPSCPRRAPPTRRHGGCSLGARKIDK